MGEEDEGQPPHAVEALRGRRLGEDVVKVELEIAKVEVRVRTYREGPFYSIRYSARYRVRFVHHNVRSFRWFHSTCAIFIVSKWLD